MGDEIRHETPGTTTGVRWVQCEIPGCDRQMSYRGRGRPPRYCGQTIDGVSHTRLTAHRLTKGLMTLPQRSSSPSSSGRPARQRPIDVERDPASVEATRQALEQLLTQARELAIEYERNMRMLAEHIEQAGQTAASPQTFSIEVAVCQRDARAAVDAAVEAAEAARKEAQRKLREQQYLVDATTVLALATVERVLHDAEEAQRQRDAAVRERDRLAREVLALFGQRDGDAREREDDPCEAEGHADAEATSPDGTSQQ